MLSFQPTWHQLKTVQSLNYLADLMRLQPEEMEQTRMWEMLGLGEFGLQQVNMLTDQLPQTEQSQAAELKIEMEQILSLVKDQMIDGEKDEALGLDRSTDDVAFKPCLGIECVTQCRWHKWH